MRHHTLEACRPTMEVIDEARYHVAPIFMDDELQITPDGLPFGFIEGCPRLRDELVDFLVLVFRLVTR